MENTSEKISEGSSVKVIERVQVIGTTDYLKEAMGGMSELLAEGAAAAINGVKSNTEFRVCAGIGSDIQKRKKDFQKNFKKEFVGPAHKVWKNLKDVENTFTDKVDVVLNKLEHAVNAWSVEVKRRQRVEEEEKRAAQALKEQHELGDAMAVDVLAEIAKKEEEDERIKQAAAAQADKPRADAILEEPTIETPSTTEVVPPPVPADAIGIDAENPGKVVYSGELGDLSELPPEGKVPAPPVLADTPRVPKNSNVTTVDIYTAVIESKVQLLQAIITDNLSWDAIEIKQSYLDGLAKKGKGKIHIPGCRVKITPKSHFVSASGRGMGD